MLTEVAIRVLCDTRPPTPTAGAYLFAQTADNQESVMSIGRDLIQHNQTQYLLFSAAGPISGYPGSDSWLHELINRQVPSSRLRTIKPLTDELLHTRIEAEALIDYAKTNRDQRILIVSTPFHQLRAFMTTVSIALEAMPELNIYNQVGVVLPWPQTVVHSQGTLELRRSQLIQAELERITWYQRKGDLASTEAILAYLEQRDERQCDEKTK